MRNKILMGMLILFVTAGSLFAERDIKIYGAEGGDAILYLYADEGDDAADKYTIKALAAGGLTINQNGTEIFAFDATGNQTITGTTNAVLSIVGAETSDASLVLDADEGDDNADTWTFTSEYNGNDLSIKNHTTEVLNLTSAGAMQIDGDLIVSGNDIDSSAAKMTIAGATATSLDLGASDIDTTILGPLEVLEATGKGIDTTGAGALFIAQANATSLSLAASDATTTVLGAMTILGGVDTTGGSAMTVGAANATSLALGASDITTTILGDLAGTNATAVFNTAGIDNLAGVNGYFTILSVTNLSFVSGDVTNTIDEDITN